MKRTSFFLFLISFAIFLKQYFLKLFRGEMLQNHPWAHHQPLWEQANPCRWANIARDIHRPAVLLTASNETWRVSREFSPAYGTYPDSQALCIGSSSGADKEDWGAEMEGLSLSSCWGPRSARLGNPNPPVTHLRQWKGHRLLLGQEFLLWGATQAFITPRQLNKIECQITKSWIIGTVLYNKYICALYLEFKCFA